MWNFNLSINKCVLLLYIFIQCYVKIKESRSNSIPTGLKKNNGIVHLHKHVENISLLDKIILVDLDQDDNAIDKL